LSPLTKQKRLIRIEASLTPKQAVRLWLRQEHQGKTSDEYLRWMMQRPPSAAPRSRVGRQVVDAIQAAMRGQQPAQVHQAVRQGQMHTDFLILLVNRTNWVILDDSRCRWLQIALLHERLRNVALSDDEGKAVNEWAVRLREFAIEMFSLQAASELIRGQYFDGECILLKDAIEDLEQQTKLVQNMMDAYDRVATEAGQPELASHSDAFRMVVNERASERAGFIVALAKSKMLDDFGEAEAADAVLKSHILVGQ
jgi:hypothetical protein